MKRILYTLRAGIAMYLCGCSSAETSLPGMPQQLVAVEFSVHPVAQRVITRTTDEDAVTDTNLYLFGQDKVFSTHLYTTSSLLRFECPPGVYRIYVVANGHADMGELTEVLSTAGHELLQALRNGLQNFRCGHRAAGADTPRKGHACAVCPGIIHKSN